MRTRGARAGRRLLAAVSRLAQPVRERLSPRRAPVAGRLWVAWSRTMDGPAGAAGRGPLCFAARMPRHIEIEISTHCTLRCAKCEHTHWQLPQKDMLYDEFAHILRQFPGLRAITFGGVGHGADNPDFMRMLEHCRRRRLYIHCHDTLLLMTRKRARRMVELAVDRLTISLDAAAQPTFEALEPGARFERVLASLRHLVRHRERRRSTVPALVFRFVVMKPNAGEIEPFLNLVDRFAGRPCRARPTVEFARLQGFDGNRHLAATLEPRAVAAAQVLAKTLRLGVRFEGMGTAQGPSRRPPCAAWTVPFVTVDGNYYPCAGRTQLNARAQTDRKAFGNLFQREFRELWDGPAARTFRRDLRAGIPPEWCRLGGGCACLPCAASAGCLP